MKRNNIILLSIILLLTLTIITGFIIKIRVQTQVKELFRLNKALQEEGYYMAEFEFKMLGFAYYLDRGFYSKAISQLSDYKKQLQSRKNLIIIPEFKNKKEELEFYLSLQNPRTGAFNGILPYDSINKILSEEHELHIIGFDILQIPRYKIAYMYTLKNQL
jgi:hypothetical protein